ncbi:MAG: GNAT family N-acetyltransferase [Actinobacteria bacterium]|nr:GNAT family N-acetyltransferase [Chloroflexota bacterium]MBE3128370.1 GNAT family N-acetyltransferase [Actinomycetota bacterium]
MIELKLADESYAEIVSKIIQRSFKEQAEILNISETKYPNYVAFETLDKVKSSIENGEKLVLGLKNEKIIGTVRYSLDKNINDKGYISRLAILPEYRGNSYGEILMKYAENQLKDLGVKYIELTIVAKFEKLKRFYEKQGYISKEKKLFPSLPFEVLFMEKKIG